MEDVIDIIRWKEEEVLEKFEGVIGREPDITDKSMYALWDNKSPILLQAHIDVVEDHMSRTYVDGKWVEIEEIGPKHLNIVRSRNVVWNKVGILGGDDRAGIIAMAYILDLCKSRDIKPPSIMLTNGEESGGKGAKKFIKDFGTLSGLLNDTRLILGLDRRGCNDYVFYVNPGIDVRAYIESFGFISAYGTYSDSKDLSEYFKIPSVNLSVGYYDQHRKSERLHLDETWMTASRVVGMLNDPIEKRYDIVETKSYGYREYGYGGGYESGHYGNRYDKRNKWEKNNKVNNNKEIVVYNKIKDDTKEKDSPTNKRQKRCSELFNKGKSFPYTCKMYPYFDYMLPDELIQRGYHIVTSEGHAKSLDEWWLVFNAQDKKYAEWKRIFGKAVKIYIKSAYSNLFYLAIRMNTFLPSSAYICEKEEALAKEALGDSKDKINNKDNSNNDKDINREVFCYRFYKGDCTGSCNGNILKCKETIDEKTVDEMTKQYLEQHGESYDWGV